MVHYEAQRSGLHLRPVRVLEAQLASAELESIRGVAPGQPPLQVRQLEQRELRPELGHDIGQRNVGGDAAHLALDQRCPHSHRTFAVPHIDRVVEPRPPRGEVGVADFGKQAAVPCARLRDRAAHQLRPDLYRSAELAGRARREAGRMFVAVVLQAEIQAGKPQRWRLAQVVMPFDIGVAHHDFALGQHPVGELAAAILLRLEQYPGDRNAALRVAPHRELQLVHFERVEAQIEKQKRPPRDYIDHARQHQRLAPARVEQAHVDQLELRAQAAPVGADPLHRHRQSHGLRHRLDDVGAIALDVREHPIAQSEEKDRNREERRPEERLDRAQEYAHPPCRGTGRAAAQFAAGPDAARLRARPRLHAARHCPYSCVVILTVNIRSDSDFRPMSPVEGALSAHLAKSRYATRLIQARPALASELDADGANAFSRAEIEAALQAVPAADEQTARRVLRQLRQRVLLRVMARDLAGVAALAEVCGTMSDLAEASIAAAQRWAENNARARHGIVRDEEGNEQRLMVVGMGKLGGRELNVSSDIDLVFVYPAEGQAGAAGTAPGARALSAHEYFVGIGRKLIALLNDATEDGFVFRVDMRLRPDGEAGALAISLDALENYFVAHGREWERYAWIKARALTGERHADLEAIRRPFVFRKYLDYATLAAMRKLHAEVRREVARRDLADNIKLGAGGIREIEFVAQALQLIRGGRDRALAARPTLEVLPLLAAKRLLPDAVARELGEAYVFLRNLEHRLQYLDDAQTHRLPQDAANQALVAAMCGFATWDECATKIAAVRATVTTHFNAVFAQSADEPSPFDAVWSDDPEGVADALRASGYRDPVATAARLQATRSSQKYLALPVDSRQRVDALVPQLAAVATNTPDPDATLARGLDLIEAIARRAAYLALLAEHREALERVARMIGAASWAADFITRHPLLLDELLDDRVMYSAPDWPGFSLDLAAQLAAAEGDTERQMNVLREAHQSQVFRLLAQDLAGILSVERLADHLSLLADILLEHTLGLCWSQLRGRHMEAPPRFAVIAYGKLGGKELGYASDLDIIFIYDDPDPAAPEVYARLAQRLNNWLTSRTSAGQLFETDLRLRPSGASGLLVSSIEGFTRYQEGDAWVWEHQALTRARFCAGDNTVGAEFESVRAKVLCKVRGPAKLAEEVLAMRAKMHAAHPNASGLFDVKHDRGGMIDIEFIVQFLVLAHAHEHPGMIANIGNIALLKMFADLGLAPADLAEGARSAYREFRKLQHGLRLNGAQYARVPLAQVQARVEAVTRLWAEVFPAPASPTLK